MSNLTFEVDDFVIVAVDTLDLPSLYCTRKSLYSFSNSVVSFPLNFALRSLRYSVSFFSSSPDQSPRI